MNTTTQECSKPASSLNHKTVLLLVLWLCSSPALAQTELRTTRDDQSSVAVTIYNKNLALVKDQRNVSLPSGQQSLAFRDVSALIRPETAMLRNMNNAADLRVLEQNFDFDLLTPQKLLDKYVGREIKLVTMNPATGIESTEQATVLSTNKGVVLKIGSRIETNPRGRFIFDQLPQNLRDKPTLVTLLDNKANGSQPLELSYLTGGLSWKADYVAELNADDTKLDLLGWVTLTNKSGSSYGNAKLQLVAGDVNQVQPNFRQAVRLKALAVNSDAVAAPMQEESLFEYHLYTLNRPTDILDKQTKQVSLLSASSVPVNKQFLLQGGGHYYQNRYGNIGQKIKIGVYVKFKNRQQSGLGVPIPKGIVRVYKKDQSGNAQFVGEDRIDHTPKNEEIRLKLGDAFDVTADKNQTDYRRVKPLGKHKNASESSYRITLKNAKPQAVTVTVRESIPGDWTMQQESHSHEKVAAGTAQWQVKIPAEDKVNLDYRVLVQF